MVNNASFYNSKSTAYYALVLIAVSSFFIYSSLYSPLLSSDIAINVLMTHDYHWPDDVYSWGQNRLGSFVPLVAQLFYKGMGLSALWSESLIH